MEEYRILELYSGIGGMHFAFKESQLSGEVVAAVDINTVANQVYQHNFPNNRLMNRNIESLSAAEINKLSPNVLLMSPPCQPFTRNGLQKDFEDRRADSFSHILNILKDIECIEYLLLENVKGFETSEMRNSFVKTLEECNFHYREYLLSPHQFGIPNSRLRYYCLGRRKPFNSDTRNYEISHNPPVHQDTKCFKIQSILDDKVDEDLFMLPLKFLKRAFVLDICYDDSERSCCFTKAYTHFLEGTGSVYTKSTSARIKKSFEILYKLDVNSEEFYRNIQNLKLRFFTPKEVSRLMVFPETFNFPETITKKQRYRLLGNSINVKVVSELIKFLIKCN